MSFDEYLDKFNSYYQLFLNETFLPARKLLLDLLSRLLESLVKEFEECKNFDDSQIYK